MTVYARVNPQLAAWLATRHLTPDGWLAFCLREEISPELIQAADELQEAATARDLYDSSILEVELKWVADEAVFVTRHGLFRTTRAAHLAKTELLARFANKWFEMCDRSCAEQVVQ